jgi:hypothetical protein
LINRIARCVKKAVNIKTRPAITTRDHRFNSGNTSNVLIDKLIYWAASNFPKNKTRGLINAIKNTNINADMVQIISLEKNL